MGSARALLVGRFCDLTADERAGVWNRVADDYGHVTIVAVADPFGFYVKSVVAEPFGVVVLDGRRARQASCVEASRRARQVVDLAPPGLAVDHVVVKGWADLWRVLRASRQADVLTADRLLGFRDRLLLRLNGSAR